MAHLPSKKVIWLVIVLVVITIVVLWYVGNKSKNDRESQLKQYTQEILSKQKNLEATALKDPQNSNFAPATIEKLPPLKVSTSSASSTEELQNYEFHVAQALKPLGLERANEVQAVISAIDKNDASLLRPVVESRIYHQTAVHDLSQVVVPQILVDQHKKILSQLNFIVSLLSNMEKAVEQPSPALNNSRSFISNYQIFLSLIDRLNNFYLTNNIEIKPQNQIEIFLSFN